MKLKILCVTVILLVATSLEAIAQAAPAQSNTAKELGGLWQAKRRFGPDIRGTLFITRSGNEWQVELAGRRVPAKLTGDILAFELAGGNEGSFRGTLDAKKGRIVGHWIQQGRVDGGIGFASPVNLTKSGENRWRGEVFPADDAMTFYLMIADRPDGSVGALLRNPERNLGWARYRADTIERDGEQLRLVAAPDKNADKRVVAEGRYRKDPETLTFYFDFGGNYDFTRVPAGTPSDFYARGTPDARYDYTVPPQLEDGWPVASLEDVGLSRQKIEQFIQMLIDMPIDSPKAQEDHGVLIARHGKLVLEEYFHGENRDKPHDTRSAAKSVASDLFGASMLAGFPLSTSAKVYGVMNDGEMPPGLEPRKQTMTVEHLLTMTSGFDCDENNEDSPGYEDKMWEQTTHPNFYRWTLDLPMVRDPGAEAVYCSANPNLVGGIIARVTGRYLPALFDDLIARPLEIDRYYLPISPTGDFTMTGGVRLLPRDFMKLAQLHLNGGTWKGRRVYTEEWSRQAVMPRYYFPASKQHYGYLWWVIDYPYQRRTIQAYFAAGNGGQISMAIPELDLALTFVGGNYNAVGGRKATSEYIPNFILPAVGN